MKQNIKKLGFFLILLFVILTLYLSYLVVIEGNKLATHPQNRRMATKESAIIRGTIYDRKGMILAETKWTAGRGHRIYNTDGQTSPFAHVIGYVSERYGSSGIEASYGLELLGLTEANTIENLIDKVLNRRSRGNDLVLTIDADLQKLAFRELNGRRGSVVAIDPRDGSILAMVSSPSFNNNNINDPNTWNQLIKDETNSPLLNRATMGAYPPGSVFKIITGVSILSKDGSKPETIQCPGYAIINGNKILDNNAHGKVDFIKALAVSCNTYFAEEGVKLGWSAFESTFKQFGLDQELDLGVPIRKSTLALGSRRTLSQLAESSFGQGDTLISPFHMALAGSVIANKGILMTPHMVKEIKKPNGNTSNMTDIKPWLNVTTPNITDIIKEGMVAATTWGTATSASIKGIKVASKTGTAETKTEQQPSSLPHAWYVGFAPADNPRIVVAVIVEKSGSGSRVAAPIGRDIIAAALSE